MAEKTIGPKELAQRALRDATYAGKNARAPKAATIETLRAASHERAENAGKPQQERRNAKKKHAQKNRK